MRLITNIRLPLWLGNSIELAGLIFGISVLFFLDSMPLFLRVVALLLSWFCLWYFSHCLTHFIFGKAFGVRFLYYFVGRSSLTKIPPFGFLRVFPVLGIKVDPGSLKAISKSQKRIFYYSGTFASMLFPMLSLIPALKLGFPVFALFFALCITNVIITLYFSPKVGDISKANR